tara:strand:- start:9277 stop:9477 length:201 start_codon:yes stop_codon:yes gene_type:complete
MYRSLRLFSRYENEWENSFVLDHHKKLGRESFIVYHDETSSLTEIYENSNLYQSLNGTCKTLILMK